MNDSLEDLIHDGIDQLTAGSTLPAGIADRARQKVRRRRNQVRATVAAGTAVAAVAAGIAVIAATSAGSAGTTPKTAVAPHPAPTVALLAKIERAIASKAGSAPVLQIKTTFPAGRVPVPPDPFSTVQFAQGGIARTTILWTRGNVLKVDWFNDKGHIEMENLATQKGTRGTGTNVDYLSRDWTQVPLNWFVYKKYIPRCTVLPLGPGEPKVWAPRTLAKEIKHALACGQVKVAGRQRVDGVDTIELAFASGHLKVPWYKMGRAVTHQTMWVGADSYLPVRYLSTLTFAAAKPGSPRSISTQSDFQWLPATKSALAKLRLIIPRGFRHDHPKTITVHLPARHK
ncbi:MAG TPA: hypothetical protein VN767_25565 [Streptosporangiaceae bacterium]|nr:hypothetical protein [Streptosporangiaceae bacterium]